MDNDLGKRWFGAKRGNKKGAKTPQEAIQDILIVEDQLQKRSQWLETKVEKALTAAKKDGSKNKRLALQHLKRKKMYSDQLAKLDGTLSTLEFQRQALENAATNMEVLTVMTSASKALKNTQGTIDDVVKLTDEIDEGIREAAEIQEAISRPQAVGAPEYDEDELLKELENLEEEDMDKVLAGLGPVEQAPLPETSSVASKQKDKKKSKEKEDSDMEKLAEFAS